MNYSISDPSNNASVNLNEHPYRKDPGITLVDVDVSFPCETVPAPLEIRFSIPSVDIYSADYMSSLYDKTLGVTWGMRQTGSCLVSGAPLHQLISADGRNRLTISLSDAMTPCIIATGINEHTAEVVCSVKLFTSPVSARSSYKTVLYLDFRDCRFDEARKTLERFWVEFCGYRSAYTPDAARRPLYSTWYSFHQNVNVEEIIRQCALAKTYGMESVIVDDGWQFDKPAVGYNRCGDWEPAPGKVPDMKSFVDRVHALGMKFILWYSVPFMGTAAKSYERFKTMLLNPGNTESPSLDPRFPEVRRYLTETYVKAAREWGIDGVKLDFIDSFWLSEDTPEFDARRDTVSLEEGVDRLLSDVTAGLRAVNPEFLIEFRQNYFGPVIRKYGNMIRVGDCACDSIRNHVAGIELRYALGSSAVHSDMLMWHRDSPVEAAAYQVITTLFLVPQISVLLDRIPESHQRMLAFYLRFWNDHRETLLDGELSSDNPEGLYSQVRSVLNGEIIAVSFSNPVLNVTDDLSVHHINATDSDRLYLRFGSSYGRKHIRITDCTGQTVEESEHEIKPGIFEFSVPRCGILEVF